MVASNEQILGRIKNVCGEVLKVDRKKITMESRFKEDLGADSLDTVILLMALEEEFKNKISDEEARKLVKVADVITLLKDKSQIPAA